MYQSEDSDKTINRFNILSFRHGLSNYCSSIQCSCRIHFIKLQNKNSNLYYAMFHKNKNKNSVAIQKGHNMLQSSFPKWRNHGFKRRLPFYVIFIQRYFLFFLFIVRQQPLLNTTALHQFQRLTLSTANTSILYTSEPFLDQIHTNKSRQNQFSETTLKIKDANLRIVDYRNIGRNVGRGRGVRNKKYFEK